MAVRRTRPPQPLAPHGIPGHLVEFVEALRGLGISVGPSETVDAGRVMSVLGLGDRETLREGLACAVLRRPDHRDTYDAMFDLYFPAALGARTVLDDDESDTDGLPPEDVEAMRQMLLDMLKDNDELANMDERLAAMIAQIVEAYGRYNSSRGPSYSSYQALKAMNLDDLEGRLLAGLLAPYGDEPTPTQEQIAKAIAAQRIAQLRKMVEGETKRRTAEQLGRDHVQMYGVPQLAENVEFLRASGEQLRQMRRVVQPLARTLATRLAARRRRSRAGEIDLRKTLRKSMSTGGVPIDVVLKKPHPARPELVVLCDVSGSVAGFSHFTLLLVHALRQQFSRVRVFAFIDTTDEVTELFGPDADLAVAVQRITREAGVYTRDGHSDYGHAFVSFLDKYPNVLSPRSSLLVLGDGRNNYRNPETDLLTHMVDSSRHAHWLNPEPRHLWGSGDSAVPSLRGSHHHARMPVGQTAGIGDRRPPAGLVSPAKRNSSRRSARSGVLEFRFAGNQAKETVTSPPAGSAPATSDHGARYTRPGAAGHSVRFVASVRPSCTARSLGSLRYSSTQNSRSPLAATPPSGETSCGATHRSGASVRMRTAFGGSSRCSSHPPTAAATWRPSNAAPSAVSTGCSRLPTANTPGLLVRRPASTTGPRVAGSIARPPVRASSWSGIQSPVNTTVSQSTITLEPVSMFSTTAARTRSLPSMPTMRLRVNTGPLIRSRPGIRNTA